MKTPLIVALGIVIGVVAGAGGMHQWLMPQLLDLDYRLAERERALAIQDTGEDASARLARLEEERLGYDQTIERLREELETLKNVATVAPAAAEMAVEEPSVSATAVDSERRGGSEGDERRRDRRGGPWGGEGTPEEREARRQEFVTTLQNNLTDFFTGELENSNTPEVQERLVALETQVHEMMDLRRQMRGVENDEERDALRAAFGDTMDAAGTIMKEQQQHMVDAIATQFNIKNDADKAAFQAAVQKAIDSPFFSDNPASLFWSAGRPEGYGGRGGPGSGRGR